jgi:hypothetical protein
VCHQFLNLLGRQGWVTPPAGNTLLLGKVGHGFHDLRLEFILRRVEPPGGATPKPAGRV